MVALDWRAVYSDMEACCQSMVSHAGQQSWDAFLLDAGRFSQFRERLDKDVDWLAMPDAERVVLAGLIQTVQARMDVLLPLAEERRHALVGLIRELRHDQKVRREYGI